MSSSSTQQQSRILICPPAFPRDRNPKSALNGSSPHRANISRPRFQIRRERRAGKQEYRRMATFRSINPSNASVTTEDGPGSSRSPSWEPTSPSLLASMPVVNPMPARSSSHSPGPAVDSPTFRPREGGRSPSSSPISPSLLAASPTVNQMPVPTSSYSPGSVDDGSRDPKSPSWSPISPSLLAAFPTMNQNPSASQENTRSPSYSPLSPPLSTLFWRDRTTNQMPVLTSSYSPGPFYRIPPSRFLRSPCPLSLKDSPCSPPPYSNTSSALNHNITFDSDGSKVQEEPEEKEGFWTGPAFTHTAAQHDELVKIRRALGRLRTRAIQRRTSYRSWQVFDPAF